MIVLELSVFHDQVPLFINIFKKDIVAYSKLKNLKILALMDNFLISFLLF